MMHSDGADAGAPGGGQGLPFGGVGRDILSEGAAVVPMLVMRDPRLTPTDKLVYGLLETYQQGGMVQGAGQRRMALDLRITRVAVNRCIARLVLCGYVQSVRRGQGRVNVYHLLGRVYGTAEQGPNAGAGDDVTEGLSGATARLPPEVAEGLQQQNRQSESVNSTVCKSLFPNNGQTPGAQHNIYSKQIPNLLHVLQSAQGLKGADGERHPAVAKAITALEDGDPIQIILLMLGFRQQQASQFAREHYLDTDQGRAYVKLLLYRIPIRVHKPGGWLRKAIEERWQV